MSEITADPAVIRQAAKRLADLKIQAMMFDMDIDIETWSLVPKANIKEDPFWLARWKDQVANGDNQAEFNVDWQ